MSRRLPKNISRYEHHRYRGWVVHVRRRGRTTVRYFSDVRHGGRMKAFAHAVAFRDRLLERLPPLVFFGLRSRSSTGVVGVRIQVDRRPQGVYRSYVASWHEPSGRRRSRTFSFKKFGKARAFQLAVDARAQAVAALLRSMPKLRPLNRRRAA